MCTLDKKVERILDLYNRFANGEVLVKAQEAERYDVNERTIQRDIDDIRAYLANDYGAGCRLIYDRNKKGYAMVQDAQRTLTNSEILAVCKILLESRSMIRAEMYPIIDKLLQCCVPGEHYRQVANLISNEKFHYLEPHHGRKFINDMWDISSAVYEHKMMRISYQKLTQKDAVTRLIQPVGVMFSEYYFYLCAYISEGEDMPDVPKRSFPTIYRIDRIKKFEVLDKRFRVPYTERFQEGEFRKRIQFMLGGELRTVIFKYKGVSIESVLDRFPTAVITDRGEGSWTIKAEVYGNGVDIWLRGQGDSIEIIDGGK